MSHVVCTRVYVCVCVICVCCFCVVVRCPSRSSPILLYQRKNLSILLLSVLTEEWMQDELILIWWTFIQVFRRCYYCNSEPITNLKEAQNTMAMSH